MAKQRIQTQYGKNQVRLNPQARPVDTFVQPSRNDQISRALNSVVGNVQRVEDKKERELNLIESGKSQAANASFRVGLQNLTSQENFARMSPDEFMQTPEYIKLREDTLSQVNDPTIKEILNNSIYQSTYAQSNALYQQWQKQDLRDAGYSFFEGTVALAIDELGDNFRLDNGQIIQDEDLSKAMREDQIPVAMQRLAADVETILKEKYEYSNTDIQNAWLKIQESRGELHHDTIVGDYLLEAGFGGPDFKNKTISLIERAKALKLQDDRFNATFDYNVLYEEAEKGQFTSAHDIEAVNMYRANHITKAEYNTLLRVQKQAVANQAALARKDQAMTVAVGSVLQGGVAEGSYVGADGTEVTLSKTDIEKAARQQISQLAERYAQEKGVDKLNAEIRMYVDANLVNPAWEAAATQAFQLLGAGDLQGAGSRFELLSRIHATSPQMLKKYVTNTKDMVTFTDFRWLKETQPSEMEALTTISRFNDLEVKPTADEINKATQEVIDNLDNWFEIDVDEGDYKNLFRGVAENYIRTIAKYSSLQPKYIAEHYADEIKADFAVVNNSLVFTGNHNIDKEKFSESAKMFLADISKQVGAYTEDELTLRWSGRGDAFWIVDQLGRTPTYNGLSKPVHLDTILGYSSKKILEQKTDEANQQLNNKSERKQANPYRSR